MPRDDPKRLATTLTTENEESCTTYNTLKVSLLAFHEGVTKVKKILTDSDSNCMSLSNCKIKHAFFFSLLFCFK